MELDSRIAIVSGASKGLGKAIAQQLVRKNAIVYGIARSSDKLLELKKELGDNFIPVAMDLSNAEQIVEWIGQTFADFSPDILINNAGIGFFKKIDELSPTQWQQMMNINLNAVYFLTNAIVPLMKTKNSFSHIINLGSIVGKTTGAEKSGYSATKYAIQGFSEALFKELRSFKIKVSVINPGSIETDFFASSGIEPNSSMLQPNDLAKIVLQVLETPDNVLIDELTVRPLIPKN